MGEVTLWHTSVSGAPGAGGAGQAAGSAAAAEGGDASLQTNYLVVLCDFQTGQLQFLHQLCIFSDIGFFHNSHLSEGKAGIVSAKAQGVGQAQINVRLHSLVGYIVQIALGSFSSRLMVGGTTPVCSTFRHTMASTASAAPSICPVMDLVELTRAL